MSLVVAGGGGGGHCPAAAQHRARRAQRHGRCERLPQGAAARGAGAEAAQRVACCEVRPKKALNNLLSQLVHALTMELTKWDCGIGLKTT